jgi:integrase
MSNPAADVSIKVGKPRKLRSKGFSEPEAQSILQAALNYLPGTQEQPRTSAAKRWVPWLCAYTGARVGEMAQLHKQDLRREGELWVITITPEAGTVKTNEARDVVLHPQLIELGFPAFVQAAADGAPFPKARHDRQGAGTTARSYEPPGRIRAIDRERSQCRAQPRLAPPLQGYRHGRRNRSSST